MLNDADSTRTGPGSEPSGRREAAPAPDEGGAWRSDDGPDGLAQQDVVLSDTALWQSRGRLDEQQIRQLLDQLLPALRVLHAQHRVYGHIAPDRILVSGQRWSLDPSAPGDRNDSHQLYGPLEDGYAAFEQYADAVDGPCGPWTDIYGLSALAYALITGQAPPDAVRRTIVDACEPLAIQSLPGYRAGFLAAIDRGLSLMPPARQQTLDEFALSLGLRAEAGAAPVTPVAPVAHEPQAQPQRPTEIVAARRVPIWPLLAALVLLVAGGLWMGFGSEREPAAIPSPQLANAGAGTGLPAPSSPSGAGEAAINGTDNPSTNAMDSNTADDAATMVPADSTRAATVVTTPAGLDGADAAAVRRSDEDSANVAGLPGPDAPPASRLSLEPSADGAPEGAGSGESMAAGEASAVPEAGDAPPQAASPEVTPQAAQTPQAPQTRSRTAASSRRAQSVHLAVRPWGELYINGVSKGISPPLKTIQLEPGTYRVRIVNGGLPAWTGSLTVQAGEPATIAHDFGG